MLSGPVNGAEGALRQLCKVQYGGSSLCVFGYLSRSVGGYMSRPSYALLCCRRKFCEWIYI